MLVLVANTQRSMNDFLPEYYDQPAALHGNTEYDIIDVAAQPGDTTTLTPQDREQICDHSHSTSAHSAMIILGYIKSGIKQILPCGSPSAFSVKYHDKVLHNMGTVCSFQEVYVSCKRENKYVRWLAVALWDSQDVPEEVSDCIVKTCFPEIRKRIRTTSTSTSGMIAINSSSGFRDTSSTTTAMITTAAGGGIRNTSFEIADEDLQLIRSKYHELISKEEEEESMLMVLIIIATVFYGIFGVIAGYESVVLLICEARKRLRSKSSSRPSKSKKHPSKKS